MVPLFLLVGFFGSPPRGCVVECSLAWWINDVGEAPQLVLFTLSPPTASCLCSQLRRASPAGHGVMPYLSVPCHRLFGAPKLYFVDNVSSHTWHTDQGTPLSKPLSARSSHRWARWCVFLQVFLMETRKISCNTFFFRKHFTCFHRIYLWDKIKIYLKEIWIVIWEIYSLETQIKKGKIFPLETHKKHNMCFLPVSERKNLKETKKVSERKIWETHHVFLGFVFQKNFLCFPQKNPWKSHDMFSNGFFQGKHHLAPAVLVPSTGPFAPVN